MFNWLRLKSKPMSNLMDMKYPEERRRDAKLLNDEGIRLANNGNREAGKQKLLAAIREDPTWGVPWNNLGVIYRDEGDNAEALRCLRKAMELGAFS